MNIKSVLSFLLLTILFVNCSDDSNNSSQSIPSLSTVSVTNITSNSCSTGGEISSNGGSEITSKGVVWSINPNPTLTDFFLENGPGNSNFTSSLTNLQPNTTYYVRAYAVNNNGIGYGDEKSFTTLSAIQSACLSSTLQNGVIAFYPFNSGSINDLSGNDYHLSNSSTATSTQDRAGNPACAFLFSKMNNDFLHFSNPTFLNGFSTQPFSISLWCKTIGTRNGGEYEVLISRGISNAFEPDTCDNGKWSLALYDCRIPLFSIGGYSAWGSTSVGETDCSTAINSWTHIVITFDGSTRRLYVNGVLNSTIAGSCTTANDTIGDLYLGKDFNGILDDVIIYNRTLTPAEVTSLFNLEACCG